MGWTRTTGPSTARKSEPSRGTSAPVDRGARVQHYLIADGAGIPLAVILTGGSRNDITQLIARVNAVPPIRGRTRLASPVLLAIGRPARLGRPGRKAATGRRRSPTRRGGQGQRTPVR